MCIEEKNRESATCRDDGRQRQPRGPLLFTARAASAEQGQGAYGALQRRLKKKKKERDRRPDWTGATIFSPATAAAFRASRF